MKQVVAFAVLAGLVVGQAAPAMACTVVLSNDRLEPTRQERARYRDECRRMTTHRRANLRAVERGELGVSEVISLAQRYESTEYGCPGDEAFAFDLLDAALPDPVPLDVDMRLLGAIERRGISQGRRLPEARLADIRGKFWLLRVDSRVDRSGFYQQALDIRSILLVPANRALAHNRFGDNNNRDSALIREVSDPNGPLFNRATFAQLALRAMQFEDFTSRTQQRLIQAARLMLDPQWGEPDPTMAQRLLQAGHFDPFFHLDPGTDALAASLWHQIGQHLVLSDNPEDRAAGEALLATGDPLSSQRAINPAVPTNAQYLSEWPAQFGEVDNWDRILPRIGQNYPPSAIRREETGPVETAVHYGPDGQLIGFVVLRSSGSITLDERTTDNWSRYFRPQPPIALPAGMINGQDLLIRMPTVEYHLAVTGGETATRQPDGRIIVTASVRERRITYSDCY